MTPWMPSRVDRYGYGTYPNVLTSLEFERLTNASGPTGGKIAMKMQAANKKTKAEEWVFEPDGPKPKAVAIIHCVGSRDQNHNKYCSRVCCMYSLKFAHLVREKLPMRSATSTISICAHSAKATRSFTNASAKKAFTCCADARTACGTRDGQMYVHGDDIAANV